MKTREEVVELFRNKYAYLKTVYPSVDAFEESAIKQNPDGGWQLSLSPYAAITLRPCDEEPHETHGAICNRWRIEGESAGKMGYPISDERNQNVVRPNPSSSSSQNGCPSEISVPGAFSDFEFGRIDWHAENKEYGIPEGVVVKMKEESTLSPKTKDLLARIDPKITELKELCGKLKELCSNNECGDLQTGVTDIVRRRRAFVSKTFFMVTFGMLKAGKSTLVNTFVGKKVSPVGRAKETTLRSSIIMASDQDNKKGIYLYSPKEGSQNCEPPSDSTNGSPSKTKEEIEEERRKNIRTWEEKNGEALMDFLTGLTTKEEFRLSFEEEWLPFSETKLEEILTSENLPEYPNILPPVIRIDASGAKEDIWSANLLKDGVAILDTPGLDGAKANMDSDPFFKSLMWYGDYFLLVQSSMSAINKGCRELIANLYRKTKNAPLLVVFNEIASNFWLKPEVEKEKLRKDSETASRELTEQLRIELGGISPQIRSINAGEASDAFFGVENDNRSDRDDMIEESRICSLRDKIVQTLREERTAIKERNATDRMLEALGETIKKIDSIVKSIKDAENKTAIEEGKRWEEQKVAASNLVNAFMPSAKNVSVGISIADRFAVKMKLYMGEEYLSDGFSVCKSSYKAKKAGEKRPDHTPQSAKEAYVEQQKAIESTRENFINRFKKNFTCDDLNCAQEPWVSLSQQNKEDFDRLRVLVNKVDNEAGDDFLSRMFQGLDVEGILSGFDDSLHTEQIASVSRVEKILDAVCFRLDKDKVWECDCYYAFARLSEKIKDFYPCKAAEQISEKFKGAIQHKGEKNARQLYEITSSRIDKEHEDAMLRKKDVERKLDVLAKAKQKVEEMRSIIREA